MKEENQLDRNYKVLEQMEIEYRNEIRAREEARAKAKEDKLDNRNK